MPPTVALLAALRAQPGVTSMRNAGAALDIDLAASVHAAPVLAWLAAQDTPVLHFATARTSLENIFLNLTGRSLRD